MIIKKYEIEMTPDGMGSTPDGVGSIAAGVSCK